MLADKTLFEQIIEKEVFKTLCGDKLGQGIGREVFECSLNKDLVIKIESGSGSFQNVVEWETWEEVRETVHAKWFAPCVGISPCGIVLVQKRTQPMSKRSYPKEMPNFLADFKYTNYGKYKGHVVAHDYGRHMLMTNGLTKRMRPVNWTDDLSY
jgi:hypothetical protein